MSTFSIKENLFLSFIDYLSWGNFFLIYYPLFVEERPFINLRRKILPAINIFVF